MRENPIELFKENADIETNHLQAALKCIGFVDEFFPNNLGGKHEFMLAIENMSMAKTQKIFHGFYAFAVQSLPVQLIALKKFSVINDIFSKMYHQVSR